MKDYQKYIRNFSIIAHIDHGKSTLADRIIEKTGLVSEREMREQFLDNMDLERERGITIKLQTTRLIFKSQDGNEYIFNLIDTPGHKDFCNETDCTLNVLDKAILVVSAVEGVQSYTEEIWGNLSQAGIPVIFFINKTDRAGADPERVNEELQRLSADCTVLNEESVA